MKFGPEENEQTAQVEREVAELGERDALVLRDHVIGLEATIGRLRRDLVLADHEAHLKVAAEMDELATLRKEVALLNAEIAALRASRPMKIGRLATAPVRIAKRLAR